MTADQPVVRSRVTRLILVRHARALNVEGRCIGQTDVPLCSEAEERLRQAFAPELGVSGAPALPAAENTVTIVSSDLVRAERTAHIMARGMGLAPSVDRRLRELSFGDWDGRTWTDIEQTDGARFKRWMDEWTTVVPPGGESVAALFSRAASWLNDALNRTGQRDSTVVAVSHAGWIRAVVCQLLHIPMAKMFDVAIDHAHATVVEIRGDMPVLVAENVEMSQWTCRVNSAHN